MVSRKLNRRRNRRNTRQRKGKKQTSKLIKCKRCNKQMKITKRNYKKIKDAGNLKYIRNLVCCGVNSDAIEPSTINPIDESSRIKPIDESKIQFYTFNSQGDYKPLPTWQADKRERMKKLMNSNIVDGWAVAPPVVEMLYDENKRLVPTYRVREGRDKMYDPETMSHYNRAEIKELPVVGNLGEKKQIDKPVKKVTSSKNQTAKKKKRRISVPIFRF